MIGKLLGHSQVQTTARYAHLAGDPVATAANDVSAALASGLQGLIARPHCVNLRGSSLPEITRKAGIQKLQALNATDENELAINIFRLSAAPGGALMAFAKLLIAWALSIVIYAAFIHAWYAASGRPNSGFVEALLGLGILLAIPGFLFALILGWPTMSWLADMRPTWLIPFVAAAMFALLMWVLAWLMLPDDWRGAGLALVGYVAVLGLVWGCFHLATAPAR